MENNKENQECQAQCVAPEKKKRRIGVKTILVSAVIGTVAAYFIGKNANKEGSLFKGIKKTTSDAVGGIKKGVAKVMPSAPKRVETPAVRETFYVTQIEAPELSQDARPVSKRSWDNKHNVQRNKN